MDSTTSNLVLCRASFSTGFVPAYTGVNHKRSLIVWETIRNIHGKLWWYCLDPRTMVLKFSTGSRGRILAALLKGSQGVIISRTYILMWLNLLLFPVFSRCVWVRHCNNSRRRQQRWWWWWWWGQGRMVTRARTTPTLTRGFNVISIQCNCVESGCLCGGKYSLYKCIFHKPIYQTFPYNF
jgi:hypothetical protein